MRALATIAAVTAAVVACSPRPAVTPRTEGAQLFDTHLDFAIHYVHAGWRLGAYDLVASTVGQTTLERMQAGRVGGGLVTCATDERGSGPRWPGLARCLAWAPRLAAAHRDRVELVRTGRDVRRANAAGRIAFMLAVEGGDQLDGNLANVAKLAEAGVRSLGLVYDDHNDFGDGAQAFADPPEAPRHGGLSALGIRAVAAANEAAIVVDVAHAAEITALAVTRRSRAPVIASHTAARALVDTPRNVSDELIRAIAATDGVIMVTFVPYLVSTKHLRWWLAGERTWRDLEREHAADRSRMTQGMAVWTAANPQPRVSIADVADHIDHVARVAGKRHVGLGSDFDGMGSHVIPELADHRGVPKLRAELTSRGWTPLELDGLVRDNVLRVFEAAERARRR